MGAIGTQRPKERDRADTEPRRKSRGIRVRYLAALLGLLNGVGFREMS